MVLKSKFQQLFYFSILVFFTNTVYAQQYTYNFPARDKEIHELGTASYEECLSTLNGKLMGCLPAKHKTSWFNSENRFFPGVATSEECFALIDNKKLRAGGKSSLMCSQYKSKFWIIDTSYTVEYRNTNDTKICTLYGNKLICK